MKGLAQNRSFRTFLIGVASAFFIFVGLILFPVNGEAGGVLVRNAASVVFSALTFFLFFQVWFSMEAYDSSRRIWGLFTIGMLLWFVAEFIWAFFEVVLKVETPYPSVADLFWVLGYGPLFWGFALRHRSLDVPLDAQQKRTILIFAATLFLLVSYFVIGPILVEFDPARLAESLLNVFYPLSDIVLLVLTGSILFSAGKGRFALSWGFIILGFIVVAVADLLFAYLSWYGFYYPDGKMSAISFLVDTGYYLSYILLSLGIFAFRVLLDVRNVVKLRANYGVLGDSKILVFVDSRGRLLSTSSNFKLLAGAAEKSQSMKQSIQELLAIDEGIFSGFTATLRNKGLISNHALTVGHPDAKNVFLTGVPLFSPQGEYEGAALVLQTELDERGKEFPLTEEQKGLAEFYLGLAGSKAEQEFLALKAYFLDQINLMYELVYEFNGQYLANSLLSFIVQKAKEKGWNIQINGQEISIPADCDVEGLSTVIAYLLRAGRTFASNIVSLALLDREMKKIDVELKPEVLRLIDQAGLRIRNHVAY